LETSHSTHQDDSFHQYFPVLSYWLHPFEVISLIGGTWLSCNTPKVQQNGTWGKHSMQYTLVHCMCTKVEDHQLRYKQWSSNEAHTETKEWSIFIFLEQTGPTVSQSHSSFFQPWTRHHLLFLELVSWFLGSRPTSR